MNTQKKLPPLEEGILLACRAIDNQIAREMQRDPAEIEQHGLLKFEPYAKRVETVTGMVLDQLEEQMITIDSVLVFAQAFTKTLSILTNDLGEKGLGNVRASYVRETLKLLQRDIESMKKETNAERGLN